MPVSVRNLDVLFGTVLRFIHLNNELESDIQLPIRPMSLPGSYCLVVESTNLNPVTKKFVEIQAIRTFIRSL